MELNMKQVAAAPKHIPVKQSQPSAKGTLSPAGAARIRNKAQRIMSQRTGKSSAGAAY